MPRLDQYYTRPDIAKVCFEHLAGCLESQGNTAWIEPSAGSGVFLELLPYPRIGIDVAPAHPEIIAMDFLNWRPGNIGDLKIVIGNPPFGKNSSLAMRFFNHAATFADIIAMILPRTFQKAATQSKLHRNFHLRSELLIGADAFLSGGVPYDVPTVFQVWEKRSNQRAHECPSFSHPDFSFVSPNHATFAFQRVGARAGLVSRDGLRKSPQSHYFIRPVSTIRPVETILSAIDWVPIKHRTAGNPSIGKAELVAAYSAAIA